MDADLALLVPRQHEAVLEGVELQAGAAAGVQLQHSCIHLPPQLVVGVLLGPAHARMAQVLAVAQYRVNRLS